MAELVNLPPHPADPYVGHVGVRPQGRAAHLGARPGRRRHLRAHRPERGRQPHPGAGVATSAAGPAWSMKAAELGVELDDRAAGVLSEELKQLEAEGFAVRGGRRVARAAHAPGQRLGAGLLRGRGLPGDRVPPRGPGRCRVDEVDGHDRGHGEAVGRRRAASPRWARATARSTRSTSPLRAALERRATRRSSASTSPTSRCGCSTAAPRTGAVVRVLIDSTDGDDVVDHRRRRHQHHRGVVAGPDRLVRLRPAAHRAVG